MRRAVAIAIVCAACGARSSLERDAGADARAESGAGADAGGDAVAEAGADVEAGVDAGDDADAGPVCGPTAIEGQGIHVDPLGFGGPNPIDPLGYPQYALDRCTLVYVQRPAQGPVWGPLVMRDLTTGKETQLAPFSDHPRRPVIAGDVVAWEADVAGKSRVFVRAQGKTYPLGDGDHSGEPRASQDGVAYTVWTSANDDGDCDVHLWVPSQMQVFTIGAGIGQQRFPDVSATHVAYTDYAEDPAGNFSATDFRASDIVVVDRQSLNRTTRHLPGSQAFPMLASTAGVAYLDWGQKHPEPAYSLYVLRVGAVGADPATDTNVTGGTIATNTPWTRPSVHDDWVAWIDDTQPGVHGRMLDFSTPVDTWKSPEPVFDPAVGATLVIAPGGSSSLYLLHASTR